ncbi:MAG: fibrillarin-like rRNA/tRNA 2'-O-methyltransferase [Promethearchaeota archaeon]
MSQIEIKYHPKFYNVFTSGSKENLKLYTLNIDKGYRVYGEQLVDYKEMEYREWNPHRSKLAAVILQNPINNFLSDDLHCLYLGASSGTTISHLSDILKNGIIYAVEFAERSIRQLIQNTSRRKNVIPIFADARFPDKFAKSIFSKIDLIYQDVSQPNQAEIAVNNCDYYLKAEGLLILAIKSQSIDSIQKSELIYAQEKQILEKGGYEIIESINIHKYAANHIVLLVRKKIS